MADEAPQRFSYEQISDLWGRIKGFPLVQKTFKDMGQMSRWYNEQTGTEAMSAGLHPSKIKDVSVGIDRLLAKTGIPQTAGELTSGLYDRLGLDPTAGQSLGESLPRGLAETLAVMGGAALTPFAPVVGVPLFAAGVAGPMAKTYTETDSGLASGAVGLMQGLLPASGAAGRAALRPLGMKVFGKQVGEGLAPRFASKSGAVMEKAFDWLGEQVGFTGNMEVANIATSMAMGQAPDFSAEHWAALGLTTIPTIPFAVRSAVKGPAKGIDRSYISRDIAARSAQMVDKALREKTVNSAVRTGEKSRRQPLWLADRRQPVGLLGFPKDEGVIDVEVIGPDYSFTAKPGSIRPGQDPSGTAGGVPIPKEPTPPVPGATPVDPSVTILSTSTDPANVPNSPEKLATVMNAANEIGGEMPNYINLSDMYWLNKFDEGQADGASTAEAGTKAGRAVLNKAVEVVKSREQMLQEQHAKLWETLRAAEAENIARNQAEVARLSKKRQELGQKEEEQRAAVEEGEQKAFAVLSSLPEDLQSFAGEAYHRFSSAWETKLDTDLTSNWAIGIGKWLREKSNQELVRTKPDEARAALNKELAARTNKVLARRSEAGRGPQRTQATGTAEPLVVRDEFGNETLHPQALKLSATGHETLANEVDAGKKLVRDNSALLATPFTHEEFKTLDPKMTQDKSNRLRAVLLGIADGQITWEYNPHFKDPKTGQQGRWQFEYSDFAMQDLKAVFGNVQEQTILKFVRDHREIMQKSLARRLEGAGKIETMRDVTLFFPEKGGKLEWIGVVTANSPDVRFGVQSNWFFKQHFLNKGYGQANAEHLANVASRIGTLFQEFDRLKIAGLVTSEQLAGRLQGLFQHDLETVAIAQGDVFRGDRPLEEFFKLTVFGHEATHGLMKAYNEGRLDPERAQVVRNIVDTATSFNSAERQYLMRDLFKMVIPKEAWNKPEVRDIIETNVVMASESPSEFVANYGALTLLGLASPSAFKGNFAELRDYIMFSPKHMGDFIANQYLDLANISTAMGDYFEIHGYHNSQLSKDFANLAPKFKELARTKQLIESFERSLVRINNHIDGGLPTMIGEIHLQDLNLPPGSVDYMKATLKTPDLGMEPNWFENVFMPAAQYAERYPIVKPIVDLVYNFRGIANNYASGLFRPFMGTDSKGRLRIDQEHSGLTKVLKDPRLQVAYNAVQLEQNMASTTKLEPAQIKAIVDQFGLSQADTDIVLNMHESTMQAMQLANQTIVRSKVDGVGVVAAHRFLNKEGFTSKEAHYYGVELSQAVWDKSIAVAQGDLTAVAQADFRMQAVSRAINDPVLFERALQDVTKLNQRVAAMKANYDSKPFHTPEVRVGRYFLRYKTSDSEHSTLKAYETREQLYAARDKALADPKTDQSSMKVWDRQASQEDINLMVANQIRAFTEIEQAAYEASKTTALERNPEVADLFNKFSYEVGVASYKEMIGRGIGKYQLKQKHAPGREEINFMQGVVDYISGLSMGLAKTMTKDLAMLYLSDKSITANPRVRNQMRDYVSQVVDPPAREWTKLKMGVFLATLGLNPSSMIIERLQPLFSLVPHLTQHGSGLVGSYKLMGRAMKLLSKLKVTRDPKTGDMITTGIDAELAEQIRRATDNQVIDFGVYQELAHNTDIEIANLRALAGGNNVVTTVKEVMSKPIYAYANFARNLYTSMSSQNSRVAFLANYLLAKEVKGLDPEGAYQFAVQGTRTTMFGGGAAARPIGMFSNLGKTYSAAGAWYTLQQYTLSSLSMMYRLGLDGFSKWKKSGITEGEIANAKKAFVQMFATQFAAAGALGMPLVGITASLFEQLFPNLNLKANVREGIASMTGDDNELSQTIVDSVLHGFGPKLLGLGALDLSGRFGLGNMLGLSPDQGFQPENALGATGTVIGNLFRGSSEALSGDPARGLQTAAPMVFKNLIKMIRDDWEVRDERGRLIYSPSDFEKIASTVGFKPKALSLAREEQTLLRRASDIEARKLRDFHEELAKELLNGHPETVRQALLSRYQQSEHTYDPVAGLRTVAQLAQEMVTPLDIREQGSKPSIYQREAISQTFPGRETVSERERYLRRKQLEQSVRLPGAGAVSPRQLREAEMVDRLMLMNPALSRQHAKAIVEQQVGRSLSGLP